MSPLVSTCKDIKGLIENQKDSEFCAGI